MTLDRNREFFQKGNDFSSVYYTSTVYMDFFLRKGVLDKPIDIEQFIVPGFLETLD